MERNENESFLRYSRRATDALFDGDITLREWSVALLGEVPYADESLRRSSIVIKGWFEKLDSACVEDCNDKIALEEMQAILERIKAEKIKVRTANLEYNANARAEARNEMFKEQIISAIYRLEPIKMGGFSYAPPVGVSGLLCLSDFHAGDTFTIKGLYGEVVNEFNYDILCARMQKLTSQIVESDMIVDELTIANLGDLVGGKLRESSLLRLREPVCDTVIRFAEFYSRWVVDLASRTNVPIKIVTVSGNHDVERNLTSKPIDGEENVAKYFTEFIKLRLKDIPQIKVCDCSDVAYEVIKGNAVMFNHGQDKDLNDTLNYFSNLYNIPVDYIFAGHLHSPSSQTAGINETGDIECIRVGSLMGIDMYAKSIRKSARPSANFSLFSEEGKTWTRQYYL